jgi:hypothetical protein
VFNQFGDLERCVLRPGNVHSADRWEGVLKPLIVRYQGKVLRVYFRADAAFAMPGVYECLEAERVKYAIRLPANQVLQNRIAYLGQAGPSLAGWLPRSSGTRANLFRASASSSPI